MANVRRYIRIPPIDRMQDKAIGVRFPFNASGVFYSTYTTAEQVKSNLLNIVLTEPGERVLRPNFGVGLRKFLFENFTDIDSLKTRIENQIIQNAPQVILTDVRINKEQTSHKLTVGIFYRIKINNQGDAIQINFTDDNSVQTGLPSPGVGDNSLSSGGSFNTNVEYTNFNPDQNPNDQGR